MNDVCTIPVGEVNLICIFDTSSRCALIAELTAALPEFDKPKPELAGIIASSPGRLKTMATILFLYKKIIAYIF